MQRQSPATLPATFPATLQVTLPSDIDLVVTGDGSDVNPKNDDRAL